MYAWTAVAALATAAMAFFSWCLVVVNRELQALQQEMGEAAREFRDWSRKRAIMREEPELAIQGSPEIRIRDHSAASKTAVLSVSMLVSNPGELLTSLLAIVVEHEAVKVLGELGWTWTSLHPMLSLPVTQLSSDPNVQKKHLITDSLPAPLFAGGLLKLESGIVRLSFDDAEKLRSQGEITIECRYQPGNMEARSQPLPCEPTVDWENH